jgi:hypothetical protein
VSNAFSVTPAEAGVQGDPLNLGALDSRFRGNDEALQDSLWINV